MAAATTAALIAGFFYAYTASVTRGLARLSDADYLAAMQAINDTVRNPIFAVSFFGALILLPAAALLHASTRSPRFWWLAAAAALYVVGGFGVTFALNVPLNEQLAALELSSASPRAIASARAEYEGEWNAWNTVRTIASTAALVCVAAGALSSPRSRHTAPTHGLEPTSTTPLVSALARDPDRSQRRSVQVIEGGGQRNRSA